jgi:histidinol-phosphate aminotransferase
MSELWSPFVHGLSPYVPGEQPRVPGLIKLNTNENPYPPSPAALEAIRAAAGADLRLYPDPEAAELKRALGDHHGLPADHVFVGNGSDEVLAHAFAALLRHSRPLLFPDISYSFYPVYCRLYDIAYETVPLDDAFAVRVDDYRRPHGGIVLPNPNAPTGRALPLADIERLLGFDRSAVVLVDEAYVDFGAQSAATLVARHPNLLVVQTLSKSRALAGLRVGFALGQPALLEGLERVKGSFNSYPLDRLAMAGALAAYADREHFERTRAQVIATRAWLAGELARLGFEVLPSAANFVFARHPAHAGAALQAALRARKILVRHFAAPRIDAFLRITIGTDEQCRALVAALEEIVG